MDKASGNWIVSSSMGTYGMIAGSFQTLASSSSTANGSSSARRIVKINSNGTWIIMTNVGVYKNNVRVLNNIANANINGNTNYWSLDMNAQGDWVMINANGTFVNSTRITTDPPTNNGFTTIETNSTGEMFVKITDRNTSNEFTWMAVSPRGIYRNGLLLSFPNFAVSSIHYSLDLNNQGDWIVASKGGVTYNNTGLTTHGISIQTPSTTEDDVRCSLNEYKDIFCLTRKGLYRNEARGSTEMVRVLPGTQFNTASSKNIVRLGGEGSCLAIIDSSFVAISGVYWGSRHIPAPPPQPTEVTFTGSQITWTSAGGSTVRFEIRYGTSPPTAGEPGILLVTSETEAATLDFADFDHEATYYISLRAVNSDGGASEPVVLEYVTSKLENLAFEGNRDESTLTISWTSLPGKRYQVQKSTNLTGWAPATGVGSPDSDFTAGPDEWSMTREVVDPDMGSEGRDFYRVSTLP